MKNKAKKIVRITMHLSYWILVANLGVSLAALWTWHAINIVDGSLQNLLIGIAAATMLSVVTSIVACIYCWAHSEE